VQTTAVPEQTPLAQTLAVVHGLPSSHVAPALAGFEQKVSQKISVPLHCAIPDSPPDWQELPMDGFGAYSQSPFGQVLTPHCPSSGHSLAFSQVCRQTPESQASFTAQG